MGDSAGLIYDWNERDRRGPLLRKPPRFVDETIRDGLQSPSVIDPTIEQKMELLRLMDRLGIHVVDLGLPGAGKRAREILAEAAAGAGDDGDAAGEVEWFVHACRITFMRFGSWP